jgi:geranylgeranyl pyrophosphate synthase
MDDDAWRRGQPACHVAFSEAEALLAGNYLLTLAFQLLAEDEGLSPTQRVECIKLLSRAAGGAGMVGGQLLDILGAVRNLEDLKKVSLLKTAALIGCSVEMGAVIAQAPDRKERRQFGDLIGLAFQLVDDLEDLKQDDQTVTFPALLGVEGARDLALSLYEQAMRLIDPTCLLASLARRMVLERIPVAC